MKKEIKEVCEVCKKPIKKAMYLNRETRRWECERCYHSKETLIHEQDNNKG